MKTEPRHQAQAVIDQCTVETPMIPVHDPAQFTEVVGHAARSPRAVVEHAIDSSRRAGPRWLQLSVQERAEMIGAALRPWGESADERAVLLTREQGKVLWEAAADVRGPEIIARYFMETAAEVLAESIIEDERGRIRKRQLPLGVTAVIVPWNTPVYLSFQHIIPALVAGNTVVVKAPENAPLAVSATLTTLIERLPEGVLNTVPGTGSEVGAVLASHPEVRQVLFTGSLPVGRSILHSAADTIKNVGLELGGNDPAIILPDAPITDELIQEIVRGVFTLTGQICFNIKRIHVHRDQLAEFTRRFKEAVDEIRVGNGLDPESTMGPVNNKKEYDRLAGLVRSVADSGARVDVLGKRVDPAGWDRGYFMLPHVVTGIDPGHDLVQEEQFGPIIPILGYSDLDAVIAEVNSSEFGLGASVWSPDVDRAFEVGSRISAGTVFINIHRMGASDMTLPFGGTKQSGQGRTHGSEILLECTEPQVLVHRIDSHRFPGPHLAEGLSSDRQNRK